MRKQTEHTAQRLQVGSQSIDLTTPVVMTIVNVTPDSFYAGSRTTDTEAIRRRIAEACDDGATILDIGGYSSRPGAKEVSPREEIDRLSRAMEIVRADFPQRVVSLDTFRGDVAREIVERFGPCIINDITAGEADPSIHRVAAEFDLPYIAMHMRGTPQTMQQQTDYGDLVQEVRAYLQQKIEQLTERGVRQVVIDPGFGFSKTTEQNYALLSELNQLVALGVPLLAGVSRKSMIYRPLKTTPEDALIGTAALHWECLRQGASILRVHDTRETLQVVRLWNYFREQTAAP